LVGDPAAAVAALAAPARVACTVGSGIGGMRSLRRLYVDPALDRPRQTDTLQETLINVTAAWPALALTGAAGPMLHPVGACATAALSVEAGLSLLRTGAADLVVAGALDDIGPEGMQGFADMGATLSAAERGRRGLAPAEASRPMDRRRAGFVEAQGGGVVLLCRADLAIDAGLPIHGLIAGAWSAGDGLQRSVPAPGLGLLRIGAGGPRSELARALGRLGLSPDDLGAVSLHGTSTEANDKNECELHQRLAVEIGRDPALPLPVIAQKGLTGHSKGGAAAWQLIGLCQALTAGVVPAIRNLEDPSAEIAARAPLVTPDQAAPAVLGRAGLLTSLGFGHVGAAVLVAHPDVLLEGLSPAALAAYAATRAPREAAARRAEAEVRIGLRPAVPPPGAPPSPADFARAVLSDPRTPPPERA
jgi:fatty acid synthase